MKKARLIEIIRDSVTFHPDDYVGDDVEQNENELAEMLADEIISEQQESAKKRYEEAIRFFLYEGSLKVSKRIIAKFETNRVAKALRIASGYEPSN